MRDKDAYSPGKTAEQAWKETDSKAQGQWAWTGSGETSP